LQLYACFEARHGNVDTARELHARALSIDGRSATTMHNRVSWATLEADAGDLPAARAILLEGLDLWPSFPAALVSLASVERRLGRLDAAEAYLRRAMRAASAFYVMALQEMVLVHAARGEGAQAANLSRHLAAARGLQDAKRRGAWASDAWRAFFAATRGAEQRAVVGAAQQRKRKLGWVRGSRGGSANGAHTAPPAGGADGADGHAAPPPAAAVDVDGSSAAAAAAAAAAAMADRLEAADRLAGSRLLL
jgi:hypothetical protein